MASSAALCGIRHIAGGVVVLEGEWPKAVSAFPEVRRDVRNLTNSQEIIRFPKTHDRPISLAFTDGEGVEHFVCVEREDGLLHIMVPLSDETMKHLIHEYRFIRWNGQDVQATTMIDRHCILAEFKISYDARTMLHNHGIRIDIAAYGPSPDHPFPTEPWLKSQALWKDLHAKLRLPGSSPETEQVVKSDQTPCSSKPVPMETKQEAVTMDVDLAASDQQESAFGRA